MNKREVDEILYMLDGYAAMAVNEDRRMFIKAVALVETAMKELEDERYMHDRLQDYCVAQGEELSKLKEQQRWIPVTERLPEEYRRVITFGVGSNVAYYVKTFYGGAFVSEETEKKLYGVTHWMPLPEPPMEE